MTKRAALYLRVSTRSQQDNESIPQQLKATTEYAEARGWSIVGSFEDSAVSGAKRWADRPQASKLLALAEAGEVDVIVMTKLDRFARSVVNGLTDFERLKSAGVGIVILNMGIEGVEGVPDTMDTTTSMGELMLTILLSFASYERRMIQERMEGARRGIIEDARYQDDAGKVWRWTGGNLPLGYVTDDESRIIEDEEQADAVRRIFDLRAQGWSTPRIADRLKAEGRRSRTKGGERKAIGESVVQYVVDGSRRHYIGEGIARKLTKGEATTVFAAPALVDAETFHRATRVEVATLTSNPRPGKPSDFPYALAKAIEHVHGDGSVHSMFRLARASTDLAGAPIKRRWYRCMAARNGEGCDGFGTVRNQPEAMTAVSADYVEAAVLRWLLSQTPEDWTQAIAEAEAAASSSFDPDAARRQLDTLKRRRAGYLEQEADGLIDRDELRALLAKLDGDAEAIRIEVEAHEKMAAGVESFRIGIADLLAMPIVWTTDGQEAEDEAHEAARNDLADNAARVLDTPADAWGRIPTLPEAVVEELRRMVAALGIRARVEATDDPRRPRVTVDHALVTSGGLSIETRSTWKEAAA